MRQSPSPPASNSWSPSDSRPTRTISPRPPYGSQRKLEIARALALKPDLLLLDEPAAGMNTGETADLIGFLRWVKEHYRVTLVLIEHHMHLVMNLCDRITVLDFGKTIADGTPDEIRANAPRHRGLPWRSRRRMSALTVENLTVSYGDIDAVKGISFEVRKGEIFTIIGANGAGKSSALRAISGLCASAAASAWMEKNSAAFQRIKLSPSASHGARGKGDLRQPDREGNLHLGAWIRKDRKAVAEDLDRILSTLRA